MMMKVCGIAALLASVAFPAAAATRPARVASITDGDTFRTTTGERVRIANVDAPKTRRDQAKCASEIQQGKAATAQLRSLIGGREVILDPVGVSYGRTVAHVRAGGVDVAGQMIRTGAALQHPSEPPPRSDRQTELEKFCRTNIRIYTATQTVSPAA